MRLLPFPKGWPDAVHTALSLLAMLVVVGAITTFIIVVIGSSHFDPRVIKTSDNTWHIYAPNNNPEDFIASTCQKDGKRVVQLFAADDTYDELNVVCAP